MILFLTAPIIVIVLLYRVQNSVFPWTAFHDWERFVQYPVDARGYLATLGFVGVIGGIGIIRAIKRKSLWWDMIIGWYLVPFIGLSITGLPVSNGRFLQSAGYIPAAILASEAIMMFREKLTSYGKPGKYLAVTIVILVIILQVPAFISSFGRQMMYVGKNMTNPLVYIPDDIRNGLTYLGYDCNGRVIAAPSGISTLIPAFSSCRVLAGHPTFTYNGADKMTDLSAIFSSVSPERIESIADKYGVMLIWVPTGALPDINFDKMDFMPDYTNSGVVIYRRIIR
jgi:hypothetical protein